MIDKLLQGNEVQWKTLGEVSKVLRGKRLTKSELFEDGKYSVFHGGLEPLGFYTSSNRPGDTVMIINVGASAGTVGYSRDEFWSSDGCFCLEHTKELNNKFLYHYLIGQEHFLKSRVRVAGIPTLDNFVVEKLLIPIPPLSVQKEIVRILDTFTTLTAELTAELTARKKQYEYYREELLDFETTKGTKNTNPSASLRTEVEWKTLGEVTLITNNVKWKETNKTYRYIDLTSVSRENNSITETLEINAKNAPSRAQKIVFKNDIIFATTRPTQLRLCLIDDEYSGQIASTGYCILRPKGELVLPKWIFFHLTSLDFKKFVEANQSGSAYPAISDGLVKEYKIPIPPLPEQERIVAILDKFDTLTNSISEGLPKEIALRQKQYEYYRNQLLAFNK